MWSFSAMRFSYGLLTEVEQTVLRRLAVFARGFTLHAAGAIAPDATHPESEIIDHVVELVAKSLVAADAGDAEPRFRLLDTTRAYALDKLAESGEGEMLARRHAEYYRDLLEAAAQDKPSGDDWAAAYMPEIDDTQR
jgi:predicted ATPase